MAPLYFLPYSATYPSAGDHKQRLQDTWNGYKSRFIDAYPDGLVHDPSKNDDPGTIAFNEDDWAVSEGQAYGMLMSVYMNDQVYFDKILDATYARLKKSNGLFAWKADKNGNIDPPDKGSATDADIIIGLGLLFADTLVKRSIWSDPGNRRYHDKAEEVINAIWANDVESGRYLKGGDSWGAQDVSNPSYFLTGALRTFRYYQSSWHDWNPVINQCYSTLRSVPGGSSKGLFPDWCTRAGSSVSGMGYGMGYDGIRGPWDLAMDAIWWNDTDAADICQKGINFLRGKYGSDALAAQGAKMYSMVGDEMVTSWHNELTVGMWAAGAMGSGYAGAQSAFNSELNNFAGFTSSGYWGNWAGAADYYFNQSMAIFSALMLGGNFVNVFKDNETILPAPASLTGQYQVASRQVNLTWNNVPGASGYKIFRKEHEGDNFVETGNAGSALSYNDTTAANGRTYIYAVGAYDAEGQVGELSERQVNCPITQNLLNLDKPTAVPNPFSSDGVWIAYPSGTNNNGSCPDVAVKIYNITGEMVRSLRQDNQNSHQIKWDGKNSSGNDVSRGMYVAAICENGKKPLFVKLAKD